jgi:hypothetical protein
MVTTRANRPFISGHALHYKPPRARSVKEQPVCLFNVFEKTKTPVKARARLEKLLKVSMESERGLTTSPIQLATVRQCFEELEALECRGTRENLSGTWRLLWTTEKVMSAARLIDEFLVNWLEVALEVLIVTSSLNATFGFKHVSNHAVSSRCAHSGNVIYTKKRGYFWYTGWKRVSSDRHCRRNTTKRNRISSGRVFPRSLFTANRVQ